ncbi:MAG: phytanoyl-CoA dioxygenase family protein [Rhodospirillales bacterium]|nr:phytanoyl-CoA dioxygenase family protein [Rhodospirillales bacterium]
MLTETQLKQYRDQGYVLVSGAAGPTEIEPLLRQLDHWIEESRGHAKSYGELSNGWPRFDLEPGHSAETPRVRRVCNPTDISDVYKNFAWNGRLPDMVADVFGPNVKFLNCRINIKMPGMVARAPYHQDHPFQPHTNDDWMTCLLFLDDMDEENGCLKVVPGSHRTQHTHFHDGVFASTVAEDLHPEFDRKVVPIIGRVGDVCLLDSWSVHGSAPNRSRRPRRFLILDYLAADAFPLAPSNMPSQYAGEIVRGEPTRVARLTPRSVELPGERRSASIFTEQDANAAYGG